MPNGRFTHVDDEKLTMSYAELMGHVKDFSIFTDEFYELYWSGYVHPEYIQFKRQKLIEWARKFF